MSAKISDTPPSRSGHGASHAWPTRLDETTVAAEVRGCPTALVAHVCWSPQQTTRNRIARGSSVSLKQAIRCRDLCRGIVSSPLDLSVGRLETRPPWSQAALWTCAPQAFEQVALCLGSLAGWAAPDLDRSPLHDPEPRCCLPDPQTKLLHEAPLGTRCTIRSCLPRLRLSQTSPNDLLFTEQEVSSASRSLVEKLAKRANTGYDVEDTLRRCGGRPTLGSGLASVESVRLEPELRDALLKRAERDQETPSSVLRKALRRYLEAR